MNVDSFSNLTRKINFKLIGLISLAAITIFILTSIFINLSHKDKVKIEIAYAPSSAIVTLNEEAYKNNNFYYLSPGEYSLRVESENFETLEETITITEETKYLYGILTAINEDGEKYLSDHESDWSRVEAISGIVANEEGEKQREEYPLISSLPYLDPNYTIDYTKSEGDGSIYLKIYALTAYRAAAIKKLNDLTSTDDLAKYNVVFDRLENPFAGKFATNNNSNPEQFIYSGFSNIDIDFTVNNGTEENDFYYAYLRYYEEYVPVIFRIILKKSGNSWKLTADPYPFFTVYSCPEVPTDILRKVNSL